MYAARGWLTAFSSSSKSFSEVNYTSAILLVCFNGVTDRLIPLFAVGSFMAFTLSQAGMVAHWIKRRESKLSAAINGRIVIADERYLRDSILMPGFEVVASYDSVMPSFAGRLSEDQIYQLIAFIKSLANRPDVASPH